MRQKIRFFILFALFSSIFITDIVSLNAQSAYLKDLENFIKIQEDQNVTAGGVVIASDLGNFDGNIESKVQTILESLDIIS